MRNGFAALVAALLLAGCASLFGPVEEPRVSITSLRILPAAGTEQRLEVGLRLINPNGFDLEAAGIVAEAGFNDISVLSGVLADPPVLPAYGETLLHVTLTASLLDGIRLVRSLMAHPDDPLRYRLEVRIDLKRPLARRLTLLDQGEISTGPPAPDDAGAS